MGAVAISEILFHRHPERCIFWTRRTQEGLVRLGVDEDAVPSSLQISGSSYLRVCNTGLALVKQVQAQQGDAEFANLKDLNLLIFFASQLPATVATRPEQRTVGADDFDHDEMINHLLELGDGLGFDVDSEFTVGPGCRVDARWRTRVANLGTIAYAFEVHRRGSRDSAILNLQRILRQDASIQKVLLVSTQDELEAFQREISSLGEDFRRAVAYFSVDDVLEALNHLDGLKRILDEIGLLRMTRSN